FSPAARREARPAMRPRPRRARLSGRLSLVTALACFAVGQVGFTAMIGTRYPEIQDPEYGTRLRNLRTRLAEGGWAQPDVLAMGSSRIAVGFRPGVLTPVGDSGSPRLVFNFGLCYSGPLLELMCLHRLLADGIRPCFILLELWPPMLPME